MSQQAPEPILQHVELDQHLNVVTRHLADAQARGLNSSMRAFLMERRVSLALDCSRARGANDLLILQSRKAEIDELLDLFPPIE